MERENKRFSKYIFIAVFAAFAVFGFALFPGGEVSAALCKDVTGGWKTGDFFCDAVFGDAGGSTLKTCSYRLVGQPLLYTNPPPWISKDCKGLTSLNFSPNPTVGYNKECAYQGTSACWLQLQATDNSDNVIQGVSYSYNIDYTPPTVSAAGAPSSWQQTSASASTSCQDPGVTEYPGGSGCDSSTYRLQIYTSSGSCSINYADYPLLSSQMIDSHKWVCAAAKDVSGNAGFTSSRTEFKVDKNAPTVLGFTVSPLYPQSVTPGQPILNVEWTVEDTGDSHLNRVEIWRAPFNASNCNGSNNTGCAWDPGSVVSVFAPEGQDSWTKTYSYSPSGDNTYEYGIHAVDNAGWVGTEPQTQKVRIKLNNTAPNLSSVVLSPGSSVKANTTITFTGNWTDSEGDSARLFVCKNDGIPSGNNCSGGNQNNQNNWCVSPSSAVSLSTCPAQSGAEGTKTYYAFECDDGDGKLCSPYISGTFVADATPPAISVFTVSRAAPSWINIENPTATISWTVSDTGGSHLNYVRVYRADYNSSNCSDTNKSGCVWNPVGSDAPAPANSDGPWSSFKSDSSDSLADGKMYWYGIHVTDVASWDSSEGCCGFSPVKVQVDKTAPGKPSLISPVNNIVVGTTRPTFDWTDVTDANGVTYKFQADQDSGFNSVDLSAQGLASSAYTAIIDLYQGNQYWRVEAKDGAGNTTLSNRGDYQILLNQPPTASVSCTPSSCIGYTGDVLTLNNNSTDPNGSSDIVRSEWDVLGWGSSPDATCVSAPILCNYTVQTQSLGPGTFSATLKVQDAAGEIDTEPKSFTIKQDAVANFNCSLDGSAWKNCTQVKPAKGETVFFQDLSTPSEGASSITNRSWTFASGNPASSSLQNPASAFQSSGAKQVSLTVTDNAGRQDTMQTTINVSLSFPDWQELSPFE